MGELVCEWSELIELEWICLCGMEWSEMKQNKSWIQSMNATPHQAGRRGKPINKIKHFFLPLREKKCWLLLNGKGLGCAPSAENNQFSKRIGGPCSAAIQWKIFIWIAGAAAGEEKKSIIPPLLHSFMRMKGGWLTFLPFLLLNGQHTTIHQSSQMEVNDWLD